MCVSIQRRGLFDCILIKRKILSNIDANMKLKLKQNCVNLRKKKKNMIEIANRPELKNVTSSNTFICF